MSRSQKIAVVGLGTVGAFALRCLATRPDVEVHGFDRYPPGHQWGAAGAEYRLFGRVHDNDREYDSFYRRAEHLWAQFESELGTPVRSIVGRLAVGSRGDIEALAEVHQGRDIPTVILSAEAMRARWPFQAYDDVIGLLDPNGGLVRTDFALASAVRAAAAHGATVRTDEEVLDIQETGSGVRIVVASGSADFDRAIVTVGAWVNDFLPSGTRSVTVYRPVLAYYAPQDPHILQGAIPFSRLDVPTYGMATADGRYLRLGFGGKRLPAIGHSPRNADYFVGPDMLGELPQIMRDFFPDFHPGPARTFGGFEGYTDNGRPIIDTVGNITYGVGFSGLGFKFAPAYGELVADLASTGMTREEGAFLVGSAYDSPVAADPGSTRSTHSVRPA